MKRPGTSNQIWFAVSSAKSQENYSQALDTLQEVASEAKSNINDRGFMDIIVKGLQVNICKSRNLKKYRLYKIAGENKAQEHADQIIIIHGSGQVDLVLWI